MSNRTKYYSPEDSKIVQKIVELIDNRRYELAMELIYTRLKNIVDKENQSMVMLKYDLAGMLIDIGEEGRIEKAVINGIYILANDEDDFKKYFSEDTLEYNLGNGKSTLFKIRRSEPEFKFRPDSIELLTEAKNHYWRAYKQFSGNDTFFKHRLVTNLATVLSSSGRISEALQYFDQVISENPKKAKAQAKRSEALLWLYQLSGSYTINLLQQASEGFLKAAQDEKLPIGLTESYKTKHLYLNEKLRKLGYKDDKIIHDTKETNREYKTHSDYRKFCLLSKLTLSEHSLYCNCIGARRDDLTIPKTVEAIGGEFIPKMELILNRLKSEYSLARYLQYESAQEKTEKLKTVDKELTFTELYVNEAVGIQPEMLKNSFRICFGILDKIAFAVCDLFGLSESSESIYFERFWNPKGNNLSTKQKERWSKINSINNIPLMALYSQATDLNTINGEWGFFKNWRNALEHGMLLLTTSDKNLLDKFNILKGDGIEVINYVEFKTSTLHLLQITRSAIFNFVFCVREEGKKAISTTKSKSITFKHKNP